MLYPVGARLECTVLRTVSVTINELRDGRIERKLKDQNPVNTEEAERQRISRTTTESALRITRNSRNYA